MVWGLPNTYELSNATTVASSTTDRNQTFANLKAWPADQVTALLDAFTKANLRVLTPNTAGDALVMLVVHADDRVKAEALLKDYIAAHAELAKGTEIVKP